MFDVFYHILIKARQVYPYLVQEIKVASLPWNGFGPFWLILYYSPRRKLIGFEKSKLGEERNIYRLLLYC
ncbi:hypothetical protein TH63_14085 [Rufibacter radiotolerans]|uniref:Uncharacterized protein n=1 Tax=Rufibacter radiotolerans TaxID=1379910 RepID=A0A0H4VRC7_9BACT|nr:hypothetical protein TH63_14085 [Rufibacter radiotolerans]